MVSASLHFLAFLLPLDYVVMIDLPFLPAEAPTRRDTISPPYRAAVSAATLAPVVLRRNQLGQ